MDSATRIPRLDRAPQSRGATMLRAYWGGKRLTRGAAILAKCCDCMGYYQDGRTDCRVTACPLYEFMPYRDGQRGDCQPANVAPNSLDRGPGVVCGEEPDDPVSG